MDEVDDFTLVFCEESRRDSKIAPPGEKLSSVNASQFQFRAIYMYATKLKCVARIFS